MALIDVGRAVSLKHLRAGDDLTGVSAQPQGAALGDGIILVRQEVNDLMGALRVKFTGVGVRHARHRPRKGDDGYLHTQADAEIGHVVLPAVVRCSDHAVDAPGTEAAGHDDAGAVPQHLFYVLPGNGLGIDPPDIHIGSQIKARMAQCLGNGQIGIVELDILAHKTDGHILIPGIDLMQHPIPVGQINVGSVDVQLPADDGGKVLLFQHNGGLIQAGQGDILNDAVRLHVAEHGDLAEDALLQRLIAAQDNDIRLYTQTLQFLDGVLGRFALMLIGAPQERHQCHMDEQAVGRARLQRDLPHGLHKGLGLDIADGAADLRNNHVSIGLLAYPVDEFLDLVGDMGNDLHGRAQILALTLLVQYVPVHLAGGQIGILVQVFIDKALIMAQVQVRLRAVLGNVDLAVLIGTHGARIHIDIRIQLLGRHLQPPGLQKASQRGRRNALAQTGNNAAGHKNIFGFFHMRSSASG